jgi:hypothetical protein
LYAAARSRPFASFRLNLPQEHRSSWDRIPLPLLPAWLMVRLPLAVDSITDLRRWCVVDRRRALRPIENKGRRLPPRDACRATLGGLPLRPLRRWETKRIVSRRAAGPLPPGTTEGVVNRWWRHGLI